jgi:hypothetical protein
LAAHAQVLTERVRQAAQPAAAAQRSYHFLRSSQTSKEALVADNARRNHIRSEVTAKMGLWMALGLTTQ